MPQTKYIEIIVNSQRVDLSDGDNVDMSLNYLLEEPESFLSKQGAEAFNINLPCTKLNDTIFNTFHKPEIEDLSPNTSFREWMDFEVKSNGVVIFKGYCILVEVSMTELPEYYSLMAVGGTGAWLVDAQNLTLWDCLSTTPHIFSVAIVEDSWKTPAAGGFDSDIDHDYVYAPVRYRQPFGASDNVCNIYMLRPSISIYWLIQRAFNNLGYTVQSQFLNTPDYFRRFVLPWVWGDFLDIEGSVRELINLKVAGPSDEATITSFANLFVQDGNGSGSFSGYVFTYVDASAALNIFRLKENYPPHGYDNFNLYTFTEASGKMSWVYNPPYDLFPYFGDNITASFKFNLLALTYASSGHATRVEIEITHIFFSGAPTTVTLITYTALDLPGGGTNDYLTTGAVHEFTVSGIFVGDTLEFKLKISGDGGASPCEFRMYNSRYINTAPSGAPPVLEKFFSTLELTSLGITVGGTVNFKQYDGFRNYNFTDMLGGLVELFNLEVQTDPISKVVTIEPMFGTVLPDATVIDGYFSTTKILDWTAKRDFNKASKMSLFSSMERQLDFTMKQDGSDGGQNIYAARYNGIYLNNVKKNSIDNNQIKNGIIAGVPGASRYMLPDRFSKGNRQFSNRFFSSVMHYNHIAWADINGLGEPPPQLITIFPEGINDSSASAISQTFEPKIAFYKGQVNPITDGGWYWEGNPAAPYTPPIATSHWLPKMFAVNYSGAGAVDDPVLTYCDQNIGGVQVQGLMRRYFLQRLAIMRNGQLFSSQMRLNLNDICNWFHMEAIKVDGSIYALIGIEGYQPFADDSNECKMWRIVSAQQIDLDNCYPSTTSVLTAPLTLAPLDLKYAPLLLFSTDIPQI